MLGVNQLFHISLFFSRQLWRFKSHGSSITLTEGTLILPFPFFLMVLWCWDGGMWLVSDKYLNYTCRIWQNVFQGGWLHVRLENNPAVLSKCPYLRWISNVTIDSDMSIESSSPCDVAFRHIGRIQLHAGFVCLALCAFLWQLESVCVQHMNVSICFHP